MIMKNVQLNTEKEIFLSKTLENTFQVARYQICLSLDIKNRHNALLSSH